MVLPFPAGTKQWMSKFSPDITWSDIRHIDMQTDEMLLTSVDHRFERTHSWIAPLLKMLLLREKILGYSKKGFLLIICKHLSEREGSFSLLLHHASGCYSGLDLLTWILYIPAAVLCFKEIAYQNTWLKKAERLSQKLTFTTPTLQ